MRFIIWALLLWPLLNPYPSQSQNWQAAYDSASVQLNLLRYHAAKPWAKRAFNLAKNQVGEVDTNYARILDVLAEAENRTDRFDDALQHSQIALAIWEQTVGKRHMHYAQTLQLVAECYQNRVEYPQAEARHTEALALVRELKGEQSVEYAIALNRQAIFYRVVGVMLKAVRLAQRAKQILEQINHQHSRSYALILKNLGELHTLYQHDSRNYPKAATLLSEALTLIRQQVGTRNIIYAEALRSLAEVYQHRRTYLQQEGPDEEPMLREALTILEQTLGQKTVSYNSCAENLSDLYRRRGQYEKARPLAEQALAFSDSVNGPTHPSHTMSLFGMYRLYTALGLYQQAEPLLRQCNRNLIREIRLFSATLNDEEREQLFRNAANGFVWLHSYARLLRQYNPAITTEQYDTQLAVKAFLLSADKKFRQRLMNSADSATRILYADWQVSRDRLAKAVRFSRFEQIKHQLRPDSLEAHSNALEKELAVRVRSANGLVGSTPLTSWQAIQRALKPDEAAIEIVRYRTYILYPKFIQTDTVHYAALIVTPNCAYPKIVILENGNDLEGPLLTAYRNDVLNQTNAADSYRQYWKPITEVLRGVRRVYLSPDGVYNQINVSTLRNSETGQYAFDEREIVLVTTTNDLLQAEPAKPITQSTAVLIGYPEYGPSPKQTPMAQLALRRSPQTRLSRDGFYDPLPATKQEVSEISQLLRLRFAVQTYTHAAAREEIVKTTSSPTVLHIATHGFFETDTALGRSLQSPLFRSGLVLAGANRALQDTAASDLFSPSRRDDGILTAYEAMNLNLDQTDLVVLSACQTGLGEVRNGEGVYGLQRAFKVAGAKSLLMSLWKVDDDVTRQLMTAFYRNWLQTNDKVRAFRLAQQSLRKKYPQPFYWGAFVLVGR